MEEIWDIYDGNRKIVGSIARKDWSLLKEGEYHIAVDAVIMNSNNEILISQRAEHKLQPLKWECNGGSILKGETSLQGVIREVKEELGIILNAREANLVTTIKDEKKHYIKDIWLFKKDIASEEITFPDKESIAAKWVSIEDFERMYQEGILVGSIEETIEHYQEMIEMGIRKSYSYLGQEVKVVVDRALGSKHPKEEMIYSINYGYVPNTKSGDGEELDCYILGVDEAVEEFEGICIAVIYRLNDNDDKLIIVEKGKDYSDEEIRNQIAFQEQYFISEIVR